MSFALRCCNSPQVHLLTGNLQNMSMLAPNCNTLLNPSRDPPLSLVPACTRHAAHHSTAQPSCRRALAAGVAETQGETVTSSGQDPEPAHSVPLPPKPSAGFPKGRMPEDWQPAAPPAGGKKSLTEWDEHSGLQLSVHLAPRK